MARVSFPAPFKMVQTICRVSFAFFRRGIPEHREGDAQCTGLYLKDALRPLHIGAEGAEHEQQTQYQHHQQQDTHSF